MSKRPPRPTKWKLASIQRVGLEWFSWKKIRKHPLPPIILSLILAGASGVKFMLPINIAIGIAALWLFLDLLPFAQWLALRRVNIDPRFARERTSASAQLAAAEREQLTTLRNTTFKRTEWAYGLVFFVIVALAGAGLINYVLDKGYAELKEDVYEHLEANSAMPSENSVPTAEITIRNQSSSEILLDSFRCTAKELVLVP